MKHPFESRPVLRRTVILFVAPVLVIAAFIAIFLSGGRFVKTENAYVQSGMVMVSSNVSGEVATVSVIENQPVTSGDPLFSLDPAPFDLEVLAASAALADARNKATTEIAMLHRVETELKSALDTEAYEKTEVERLLGLISSNAVSKAKLAEQQHALEVARNRIATVEADIQRVRAALGGKPDQPLDALPKVRRALVAVEKARLDRRYADVKSAVSGIVARIDLHPGEYVDRGAAVFSIVENNTIWVEANLKETQLTNVRTGQSATVTLDAWPDRELAAIITGVSPATGSEYAILPPQNATGNWVKVNQRVPVRLEIVGEEGVPPLRAGMTATVTIDTGHRRQVSDLFSWIGK